MPLISLWKKKTSEFAIEEFKKKIKASKNGVDLKNYRQKIKQKEKYLRQQKDALDREREIAIKLKEDLDLINQEYKKYLDFYNSYKFWLESSNRAEYSDNENKKIFCRESVYVQLNKILLIRIAEDKGMLNKMVSDCGVHSYFDFYSNFYKYTKMDYKNLFLIACKDSLKLYEHFFAKSIFDWELQLDGELDKAFQMTFWYLNHFDFSKVNRDILGKIYEKHLPPKERKALGGFFTSDPVIEFILDEIGYNAYTSDNTLINKTLLDPGCGSGGFTTSAANRLVDYLETRGGITVKEMLEQVTKNIYGFDIDPFACHIAEMNLLFQLIGIYKKAKESDSNYTLKTFNIYRTDSLEIPDKIYLPLAHYTDVTLGYAIESAKANLANFVPEKDKDLIEKIESNTNLQKLGEICYTAKGMETGLNSVFILDKKTISENKIEEDLIVKLVKSGDI